MPTTTIQELDSLITAFKAGHIDREQIKLRVEAERSEREQATFGVYGGFGSAAVWAAFLATFERMTDAELDATLQAELQNGRRQFELTAIAKQFYKRGNLAALERLVPYCQRLTSIYQLAKWVARHKSYLEG